MKIIPRSESNERDAERARERWASLNDKERRQMKLFLAALWLFGMALVLADVLTNTRAL